MATKECIARVVNVMCAMLRQEPSALILQGYMATMADLDDATFERAAMFCLNTCKFLPTPKELRDAAGVAMPMPEDRGAMAFQALKSAISRYGRYRSPNFDDPIINASIRVLGGWERACDYPEADFDVWYRKEFIAAYGSFSRCGATVEQAAPLLGETERANTAAGFLEFAGNDRATVATGLPWAGSAVAKLGANEVRRIEQKA